MSNDSERTDAGEQRVIKGIKPLTLCDRLAARAARPMRPKRNPHAEQKTCDHGLFDEVGRAQTDIVDLIKSNKEATS